MQLANTARILVCLQYGIGDVVMQLPSLNALRRSAPAAKITALGAAPATELLEGEKCVNEVLSLQRWGIRHLWDSGTPFTNPQIVAWLRLAGFEPRAGCSARA
jgi:ADP-heptose:LPS heptosyltransferase